MDSTVALAVQCICAYLVTLISLFLMRSIKSATSRYWTVAWSCLAVSLTSLVVAFHLQGAAQRALYVPYFFGQYCFGLVLVAGCRSYTLSRNLSRRYILLLLPFGMTAAGLAYLSQNSNNLFIVHGAILAVLFGAGMYWLDPPGERTELSPGVRVTSIALFLLSLDCLQYVLVFASRQLGWNAQLPVSYFNVLALANLVLEILLGFGTIMVLAEHDRGEADVVNQKLTHALHRLERLARMDPLTEALTRHAFHSLFSNRQKNESGCVAVIDLDELKSINDGFGHGMGDTAIRTAAKAIRTIMRPDDMLFRWGGDEFLVLMFGISEGLARKRFDTLNATLEQMASSNPASHVKISVSHGLAAFSDMVDVNRAIERADQSMYKSKAMRTPRGA